MGRHSAAPTSGVPRSSSRASSSLQKQMLICGRERYVSKGTRGLAHVPHQLRRGRGNTLPLWMTSMICFRLRRTISKAVWGTRKKGEKRGGGGLISVRGRQAGWQPCRSLRRRQTYWAWLRAW